MEELDRRGVRDNTLIVLTSDHGEEFLEHGDHEHGSNLYHVQLAVPLVVLFPGRVPPGVRVPEPVSTRDVAATIAGMTRVPGGGVFVGRSLALRWEHAGDRALLSNEPVLSELIPGLAQDRRIRSIIAGRYHYIRGLDGRYEMYDYIADPLEKRDLAPSVAADELPPGLPPGLPR
jgi:arylsulfatase A-like enzyme